MVMYMGKPKTMPTETEMTRRAHVVHHVHVGDVVMRAAGCRWNKVEPFFPVSLGEQCSVPVLD